MKHEYEIMTSLPGHFSFSTALELLKQGYALKRREWVEGKYIKISFLWDSCEKVRGLTSPCIVLTNGDKVNPYVPTNTELLAVDWAETTPILDDK